MEAERIRRETRVVDETPRKAKHPRADDDQSECPAFVCLVITNQPINLQVYRLARRHRPA